MKLLKILYYWPLGLLVFIPIIILLYLLKQKAEDYPFSSLYLWRETYKNIEATKPWEKLKNNLLMYLQIITMLGLIFALTAPYFMRGGKEYKNVVMVLDNSGSMNTLLDGKKTRLEVAKEKALDYFDDLRSDTRVTILSSNQTAKIELAGASDKNTVKKALNHIAETDIAGNLEPSISLVESMASQWEGYEAVLFSDTDVDMGKINGKVIDVSSTGRNGAVAYVSHTINENGSVSVLAKVQNCGTEALHTDINLYCNDEIADIQPLSIPQGESQIIYFKAVELSDYAKMEEIKIKAELNEKDMLANDNIAYDVVKEDAEKKVLLVTEQNIFLEKAILTNENISLYKTTDLKHIDDTDTYDLYVYDGIMPKVLPKTGNLIFINPTVGEHNDMFTVEKQEDGVKAQVVEHDITNVIKNVSFGVGTYASLQKPAWAETFLKAGKQSLGFIGTTKDRMVAVLGFDLHQSDLPLMTEFPILINQMVHSMVKSSLLKETVITAGETIDINGMTQMKTKAGIYEIKGELGSTQKTEWLGVNFPVEKESTLQNQIEVTGSQKDTNKMIADSIRGGIDLRGLVILILIVLLGLEWTLYIRRS